MQDGRAGACAQRGGECAPSLALSPCLRDRTTLRVTFNRGLFVFSRQFCSDGSGPRAINGAAVGLSPPPHPCPSNPERRWDWRHQAGVAGPQPPWPNCPSRPAAINPEAAPQGQDPSTSNCSNWPELRWRRWPPKACLNLGHGDGGLAGAHGSHWADMQLERF
jgi:hypothetical protein